MAPTVSADQTAATAPENTAASNSGSFSDYDDAVTLAASVGTLTVSYNDPSQTSGTWGWTGSGDESTPYSVAITAVNADHTPAPAAATFDVSFSDVAPTVSADQTAVTAPENTAASNSGSFSDYDDAVTLAASVGDLDGELQRRQPDQRDLGLDRQRR